MDTADKSTLPGWAQYQEDLAKGTYSGIDYEQWAATAKKEQLLYKIKSIMNPERLTPEERARLFRLERIAFDRNGSDAAELRFVDDGVEELYRFDSKSHYYGKLSFNEWLQNIQSEALDLQKLSVSHPENMTPGQVQRFAQLRGYYEESALTQLPNNPAVDAAPIGHYFSTYRLILHLLALRGGETPGGSEIDYEETADQVREDIVNAVGVEALTGFLGWLGRLKDYDIVAKWLTRAAEKSEKTVENAHHVYEAREKAGLAGEPVYKNAGEKGEDALYHLKVDHAKPLISTQLLDDQARLVRERERLDQERARDLRQRDERQRLEQERARELQRREEQQRLEKDRSREFQRRSESQRLELQHSRDMQRQGEGQRLEQERSRELERQRLQQRLHDQQQQHGRAHQIEMLHRLQQGRRMPSAGAAAVRTPSVARPAASRPTTIAGRPQSTVPRDFRRPGSANALTSHSRPMGVLAGHASAPRSSAAGRIGSPATIKPGFKDLAAGAVNTKSGGFWTRLFAQPRAASHAPSSGGAVPRGALLERCTRGPMKMESYSAYDSSGFIGRGALPYRQKVCTAVAPKPFAAKPAALRPVARPAAKPAVTKAMK